MPDPDRRVPVGTSRGMPSDAADGGAPVVGPDRGRHGAWPGGAGPLAPRTWTTPTSGVLGVPFGFCPACGASLRRPEAFVQELWVSEESVFHVWCPSCGTVADVILVHRMVGYEAEG